MKPFYTGDGVTIYCAKADEVVPRLPEKQFGVLVLDPPFTFSPDNFNDVMKLFVPHLTESAHVRFLQFSKMSTYPAFGHPHVRPLSAVREMLEHTHGAILDPYMGTGTTLVAAHQLGRYAVGIEIDPKYCQVAVDRLSLPLVIQ